MSSASTDDDDGVGAITNNAKRAGGQQSDWHESSAELSRANNTCAAPERGETAQRNQEVGKGNPYEGGKYDRANDQGPSLRLADYGQR